MRKRQEAMTFLVYGFYRLSPNERWPMHIHKMASWRLRHEKIAASEYTSRDEATLEEKKILPQQKYTDAHFISNIVKNSCCIKKKYITWGWNQATAPWCCRCRCRLFDCYEYILRSHSVAISWCNIKKKVFRALFSASTYTSTPSCFTNEIPHTKNKFSSLLRDPPQMIVLKNLPCRIPGAWNTSAKYFDPIPVGLIDGAHKTFQERGIRQLG